MSNHIVTALEKVTEGDKEFMKELSAAFIINFKEFEEGIKKSVDNRDLADFRSLVHKVKPSFLTIEMQEEFEKLDAFGKDLDQKSEKAIEDFKSWVTEMSEETIAALSNLKI